MKYQTGKANLLFIAIAVIAVGIGIFVQTSQDSLPDQPEFSTTLLLPKTKAIGHGDFTDHLGKPFGPAQMQGKWSILFFGFTNCPDICPTTMQTLKEVKQTVSAASAWSDFQVIMVSVDPERDTQERLAAYVPYFDPEFIGIVGDVESTTEFAKQVGILFVKRDSPGNAPYEVDHSASIILINPQGEWAGVISAPHKADEISSDLIKLAKYSQRINNTAVAAERQSDEKPAAAASNSDKLPESAELSVSDAWIRPAPPGATSMAAYFELSNNSNQAIEITSADSPQFDMAMIHSTVVEDGIASMEHMDGLTIPANSTVDLKPMGTHMMLVRPVKQLSEGDRVDVTLSDSNGNEYHAVIQVRQPPK